MSVVTITVRDPAGGVVVHAPMFDPATALVPGSEGALYHFPGVDLALPDVAYNVHVLPGMYRVIDAVRTATAEGQVVISRFLLERVAVNAPQTPRAVANAKLRQRAKAKVARRTKARSESAHAKAAQIRATAEPEAEAALLAAAAARSKPKARPKARAAVAVAVAAVATSTDDAGAEPEPDLDSRPKTTPTPKASPKRPTAR